ncbi:hypothetical protein MHK_004722, partial [Candidatus Magnetomorum sp. HK-1]
TTFVGDRGMITKLNLDTIQKQVSQITLISRMVI